MNDEHPFATAAVVTFDGTVTFDWIEIARLASPDSVRSYADVARGVARALMEAYAAGRAEGAAARAVSALPPAVPAPLPSDIRPAAEHGLTAASLPPAARRRDRLG